uniref:S-adenosylmethionine:tRNA ribosyltransferase-isomerase n=1 Tax=Xanthomonas phaseoli TaxID=1985254 RepID=UPI001ED94EE7
MLRIPNPESPFPAAVTLCGYSDNDPAALKKSDFHYDLPDELIAQAPLAERAASRLLVVPPSP